MKHNIDAPEPSMTEFLTKSLVAAGVFLAIPAAFSAAFAAFMLWRTWPSDAGVYAGWLAFCGLGFFLLACCIRVVRSPERVRRPRLIWFGTAAYLGTIVVTAGVRLLSLYNLARSGDLRIWGGEELGPDSLVVPALLLLLPLWAFILSTILCFRRKCA